MIIEYTKSYYQKDCDYFTIYDDLSFKDTNIFWEFHGLISRNKDKNKEELLKIIDGYIPKAKSKYRHSLEGSTLSFYPPNKYIFPKLYVIFK